MANFDSLAALLPDAVLVVDDAGVLHYSNPAAERLLGVSGESRLKRNCFDLIHPGDLEMVLLALGGVKDHGVATPIEFRAKTPEGWRVVEMRGVPIENPVMGKGIALCIRDLTDRGKREIAPGNDEQFRAMLQNGVGLMLLVNPAGEVASASAALTRTLGLELDTVLGNPLIDLVSEADHRTFRAAYQKALRAPTTNAEGTRLEVRLNRRSGIAVPYQLTLVNLLEDPAVNGIVVTGHDISELRAAQEELGRLVYLDPLTGLPNRGELVRELTSRLRPRRDGEEQEFVVAYMDLDRFKPVNDLFGHLAGDELLINVGKRLSELIRDGEMVARFGGDEFVVVGDATGTDPLYGLCSRLEAAIAEPFHLEAGTVQLSASVGGVLAYSGDPAETVLAEADTAMYTRKRRGQTAQPSQQRPIVERRSLAEGLEQAFEKEEFVLFYQPIVDIQTSWTVEFEALVRWKHPDRGILPPGQFLDIIEDVGRDGQLANYVLHQATADLARMRNEFGLDVRCAVNASANQFSDPGFADLVSEMVSRNSLPPDAITIEVSERSILQRAGRGPAATVVNELQSLVDKGVRIAVDDFGTGYSSLTHLVSFPVDSLKIDRSFIANLMNDSQSRAVVTALIGLARSMKLDVVAEGVESQEQLRKLRRLGCRHVQGFYLGVPKPFTAAIAPLVENKLQHVGQ